jgi:hypothetical protein
VLDLAQIPANSMVTGRLGSVTAARNALANHPEVQRLLDSVRIVLTVDEADVPVNAPTPGGGNLLLEIVGLSRSAPPARDCVHIFTRAPRPEMLRSMCLPATRPASRSR